MKTDSAKREIVTQKASGANPGMLTAAEVKTRLREQHQTTLKEWAKTNGYSYDTVSCVVRGINRGTYGLGHRIAVELGMKRAG